MIKPIDPRRPVLVVHPDEKRPREDPKDGEDAGEEEPLEGATRWPVYGLPSRAKREIDDRIFYVEQGPTTPLMIQRAGTATYLRCKLGIGKPEGGPFEELWQGEDSPLVAGRQVPTDEFLDRVPEHVREWLALQVLKHAALSEADLGNSSPPSTSRSGTSKQTASSADSPETKD